MPRAHRHPHAKIQHVQASTKDRVIKPCGDGRVATGTGLGILKSLVIDLHVGGGSVMVVWHLGVDSSVFLQLLQRHSSPLMSLRLRLKKVD